MIVAISLLSVLLQSGATQSGTPVVSTAPAQEIQADSGQDSARRARHAARVARREALEAQREVPLTPALLASAYDGSETQALIELARMARVADDSAIHRYDANSVERFSAWLAIGAVGRDRLLFRRDRAEHVRWQRGLGAIVDVTGSRAAVPLAPSDDDDVEDMNEAIALPYVPGRRTLALGGERGADTTQYTEIDDIIDPLAPGAEAYYRYTLGDSEVVSLPSRTGGPHLIRLREIRLHPRRPIWNIAAGALWFDVSDGHLVRAVYRFAAPMDVVAVAKDADPNAFKDVPFWVKPMIMPMTASLDGVTLEYGQFAGRYWLPIARYAEGSAKVNLFRARIQWELRYHYESVNGPDTLPRYADFTRQFRHEHRDINTTVTRLNSQDSAMSQTGTGTATTSAPAAPPVGGVSTQATASHLDSAHVVPAGRSERGSAHLSMRSGTARDDLKDSVARAGRKAQCERQSTWDHLEEHDGGTVRVIVRTPCDSVALAHSPALPPSIYDPGETTLNESELTGLLSHLGTEPEPDWGPRPVELRWGLEDNLIRYNRIEALSVGVAVQDELGLGLTARAEARMGEDLEPNAELELTRASPIGTVTGDVYRRLSSANDWGDPFTVGASVWNLLVGDDEGFYYRAWGGEVRGTETNGALPFSWRLFVEQEWTARVLTQFSFTKAVGGDGMSPVNLVADAGTYAGMAFDLHPVWGTNPDGFQLLTNIRGEGAGGASMYIRGAADLTLIHPVTRYADAAITGGAGTSAGEVPAQREWYLGGLHTIRGIAPGQDVGDAYWMFRNELGLHSSFFRPIVFYDVGWAGDRIDWSREGRPLSGAGVGASLMDGILRLDIAHGIWPTHSVRVNVYWQGTF